MKKSLQLKANSDNMTSNSTSEKLICVSQNMVKRVNVCNQTKDVIIPAWFTFYFQWDKKYNASHFSAVLRISFFITSVLTKF